MTDDADSVATILRYIHHGNMIGVQERTWRIVCTEMRTDTTMQNPNTHIWKAQGDQSERKEPNNPPDVPDESESTCFVEQGQQKT